MFNSPQFNTATGEFRNANGKEQRKFGFFETLKIGREVLLNGANRVPKGKLPEKHPDLKEFLSPSEKAKFIWLGHSTMLLRIAGKTLLIDPVLSGSAAPVSFLVKRFQPPVLNLDALPPIDIVVISHDHYDHLDEESIRWFKNHTETRFMLPLGLSAILEDWGITKERTVELDWHQSHEEGGLKFVATPAQHFSGRGLFDKNKTLWVSWIIESKGSKIFYSGDSGYGTHFAEIGKKYGPFDLAFIENGQYNKAWPDVHMFPEEVLEASIDLRSNYLVPVHWGMFDLALHHWSEPAKRIYELCMAKKMPLLTPELGEVIDLASPPKPNPWWLLSSEIESQITK